MVEKLTLFELHMDSPRFGTNDTIAEEIDEGDVEEAVDAPEGPSFRRLVLASIAFSIAVTLLVRRLTGGEDTEAIDIEAVDDDLETPIEVEY